VGVTTKSRYSPVIRLRLFLRRVTPLTWGIWLLLIADLAAPGYGRLNLLITQVDLSNALSIARTGKPYAAPNTPHP
jgi:hypothetical protein